LGDHISKAKICVAVTSKEKKTKFVISLLKKYIVCEVWIKYLDYYLPENIELMYGLNNKTLDMAQHQGLLLSVIM